MKTWALGFLTSQPRKLRAAPAQLLYLSDSYCQFQYTRSTIRMGLVLGHSCGRSGFIWGPSIRHSQNRVIT